LVRGAFFAVFLFVAGCAFDPGSSVIQQPAGQSCANARGEYRTTIDESTGKESEPTWKGVPPAP